jgi:hypothetical protein
MVPIEFSSGFVTHVFAQCLLHGSKAVLQVEDAQ